MRHFCFCLLFLLLGTLATAQTAPTNLTALAYTPTAIPTFTGNDPLYPWEVRLLAALKDKDMALAAIRYDSLTLEARRNNRVAFSPRTEIAFMALFQRWRAIADSLRFSDPFYEERQNSYTILTAPNGAAFFMGGEDATGRPATEYAFLLLTEQLPALRKELRTSKPAHWEDIDRSLYHLFYTQVKVANTPARTVEGKIIKRCLYPDTAPCTNSSKKLSKMVRKIGRRFKPQQNTFPYLLHLYNKKPLLANAGINTGIDFGLHEYNFGGRMKPEIGYVRSILWSFEFFGAGGALGGGFGPMQTFGTRSLIENGVEAAKKYTYTAWCMHLHYSRIFYHAGFKKSGIGISYSNVSFFPVRRSDPSLTEQVRDGSTFTGNQYVLQSYVDLPLGSRINMMGHVVGGYDILMCRLTSEIGPVFGRLAGQEAVGLVFSLKMGFSIESRVVRGL